MKNNLFQLVSEHLGALEDVLEGSEAQVTALRNICFDQRQVKVRAFQPLKVSDFKFEKEDEYSWKCVASNGDVQFFFKEVDGYWCIREDNMFDIKINYQDLRELGFDNQ